MVHKNSMQIGNAYNHSS